MTQELQSLARLYEDNVSEVVPNTEDDLGMAWGRDGDDIYVTTTALHKA